MISWIKVDVKNIFFLLEDNGVLLKERGRLREVSLRRKDVEFYFCNIEFKMIFRYFI